MFNALLVGLLKTSHLFQATSQPLLKYLKTTFPIYGRTSPMCPPSIPQEEALRNNAPPAAVNKSIYVRQRTLMCLTGQQFLGAVDNLRTHGASPSAPRSIPSGPKYPWISLILWWLYTHTSKFLENSELFDRNSLHPLYLFQNRIQTF